MSLRTAASTGHGELPRTGDADHPPHRLLQVLRPAARAWFRRRYDVHVHGARHVAPRGPHILVCNHIGLLDGPLLAAFAPRRVHALTKREMFTGRTGRALQALGQIPLSRYSVDPAAIKSCLRVLRDGGVVAIFPEGTRGAGEVVAIHRGAAYLALATGAPVVPVAVIGTREAGGLSGSTPPRGARFDVVFGPPVYWEKQSWPRTRSQVRETTEQIRLALLDHVELALEMTDRELPGPMPDFTDAVVFRGLERPTRDERER